MPLLETRAHSIGEDPRTQPRLHLSIELLGRLAEYSTNHFRSRIPTGIGLQHLADRTKAV